ncbi:hypothetical protein ACEN2I_06315 [Flavobacterium sp. W22_SRS_FK3]|uniref:hypothetical protein n=1 Tax=Flavobacterium sp. W22_SRS_FK3 TaxID=3240275 RepID=UPI003F8E96C2
MKFFTLLLMPIFFFSCQQKENKKNTVHALDTLKEKNTEHQKAKEKIIEENKQKGDTIYMNFRNEKGLFATEGSLDSIHPRIFVKFKNENSGELKATIIPTTGKGNIRFNQIIFPDKTSDGPFGMDLKIPLRQKGYYVIVIGRSLMADNPFFGKFEVVLDDKEEEYK